MKLLHANKKTRLVISCIGVCALVMGLTACAPRPQTQATQKESQQTAQVQLPAPNENGIITADSWKDIYPNEYASYEQQKQRDGGKEYQETYPEEKVLWAGSSFAKSYTHPNGHPWSLRDVEDTARAPKKAQCLTCKSSEFILMQDKDPSLNNADIHEVEKKVSEPISCYDCHKNSPKDGVEPIRQFFIDAVGSDASKLPKGAMACGQCHNEYLMPGPDGAAQNAFKNLAEATPDKELAYENSINYVDHTNPTNGTKQLKVQHPEFETMYGGDMSPMAKQGYSCADCHMGKTTAADGQTYTNHNFGSPLENDDLIANDCSKCHKDIKAEVKAQQQKTIDRIHAVGAKIEQLDNKMSDIVAKGTMSDAQLDPIRDLNRTAQWYWDYVTVENSKGAHNPDLAKSTLDKSEAAVDQALAQL